MPASRASMESQVGDFAELLSLAESLRDKVDRLLLVRRKYLLYESVGVFVALGCMALGVFLLLGGTRIMGSFAWVPIASGGFAGLSVALAGEFARREHGRSLRSEIRAMNEVIVLISETEGALAEAQHWTPLQRAQYTIRMSRLNFAAERWQWMDHTYYGSSHQIGAVDSRE